MISKDKCRLTSSLCSSFSSPHRKEPVGGENEPVEVDEQKKRMELTADPATSLPGCLGHKDHDALLAMRDQARLVSTAIQLLTSPESNCLSSTPSAYHKVCNSEAAEPCDLEKQPRCQVHILRSLIIPLGLVLVVKTIDPSESTFFTHFIKIQLLRPVFYHSL